MLEKTQADPVRLLLQHIHSHLEEIVEVRNLISPLQPHRKQEKDIFTLWTTLCLLLLKSRNHFKKPHHHEKKMMLKKNERGKKHTVIWWGLLALWWGDCCDEHFCNLDTFFSEAT